MSTNIGNKLHSLGSFHKHSRIMFLFQSLIITNIRHGSSMSYIPWSVSKKSRKFFVIDVLFKIFIRTEEGCKWEVHRKDNFGPIIPPINSLQAKTYRRMYFEIYNKNPLHDERIFMRKMSLYEEELEYEKDSTSEKCRNRKCEHPSHEN